MCKREDRITVRFNGFLYQKYSDRPYYERVGGHYFLHRDTWIYYKGEIPEGYHIHHKDENTSNNTIENLEMLTAEDHRELHKEALIKRSTSPEHFEHLAKIRPLTVEWHGSKEGKEWHKAHALKTIHAPNSPKPFSKIIPVDKVCGVCQRVFISKNPKRQNTCSQECHNVKHNEKRTLRRKENAPERSCQHCTKPYTSVYKKQRFCCTQCKQASANARTAADRKSIQSNC